jgi:hypothetical protein
MRENQHDDFWVSKNSRTSSPPALVSLVDMMLNSARLRRLNCPAPDELTSFGKLPLRIDSHIVGLPIRAMVKSTFDAVDTRNTGEHTLDFHLEIRQRLTHRRRHTKGDNHIARC